MEDSFVAPGDDDLNYKDIGEQELLRELWFNLLMSIERTTVNKGSTEYQRLNLSISNESSKRVNGQHIFH